MPSQSVPQFVKLATGGVSEPSSSGISGPASGGVSQPATGGVSQPATGGVSGLASGGASGPASDGAAARVFQRSPLLPRLKRLVNDVREAMAARPQL